MTEVEMPTAPRLSSSTDLMPVSVSILKPQSTKRPVNIIVTSKYTKLTFLPYALFELLSPFRRFANFFYLVVGALLLNQTWHPQGTGMPTTWASLTMILCIDMYVLAKDDIARHRADAQTNAQPVSIISPDGDASSDSVIERRATWADVEVGDVVRVRGKEAFPADLLLLRGSDPPGSCWVSTKALDGESDMKLRIAPNHGLNPNEEEDDGASSPQKLGSSRKTSSGGSGATEPPEMIQSMTDVNSIDTWDLGRQLKWGGLKGELKCEEPNDKVNDFTGELHLESGLAIPIGPPNMLLRGCLLQNTDWVLGLVVATGTDTKINHGSLRSTEQKRGIVAKSLNTMVIIEITLCFSMCIVGAIMSQTWYGLGPSMPWYLISADDEVNDEPTMFSNGFNLLMMFFLILYSMMPATLFVSCNLIYLNASAYMSNDLDMYHEEADEPCRVRQMSLVDELGQVSHIFSDKTGTLTSNHMEFKRLEVDGTSYGVGETAISISLRAMAKPSATEGLGKLAPASALSYSSMEEGSAASTSSITLSDKELPKWAGCRETTKTFVSYEEAKGAPSIYDALAADTDAGRRRRELMLHLAVNQSVLLDEGNLSASSPDELAFVAAAEHFGYEFCARRDNEGELEVRDKRLGVVHVIKVHAVFAYESSRKRMSVLVELPPALLADVGGGAAVRLYTKGQDSIVLQLLRGANEVSVQAASSKLSTRLGEWAEIALRTMVFAKRELPPDVFDAWYLKYDKAERDPAQLMKHRRGEPNDIEKLQVELEAELTLQGATAIEDKLQDGVPEILADLRKAQIKLWMLTGDKVGTAKNIAMACNILPQNADVLELTTETYPVLGEISSLKMTEVEHIVERAMTEGAHPEDANKGYVAKCCGNMMRSFGDKAAEEAYREAVAAVIKEQTDKLDAKHPGLKAVRAALELRLREMDEEAKAMSASGGDAPKTLSGAPASASGKEFCLVLDESAIEYCATLCKDALAQVGDGARSVVACRARKDQKAQMLNLIKEHVPISCCLAIGDGANDVAMIKAGQIGVGIIGKEGMAAVNNSDFAIGQFRFLRGLLLVHGRANYRRMALFNYYVLYKGTVICVSIFYYSVSLTMSSAAMPYLELFYVILYMIVFTVRTLLYHHHSHLSPIHTPLTSPHLAAHLTPLPNSPSTHPTLSHTRQFPPIIITAINDFDVPKHVAASTPELYTPGIRRVHFTLSGYFKWTFDGLWAAAVCIYLPVLAISADNDGYWDGGQWAIGWAAMIIVTLGVTVRLWPEIWAWTILEFGINALQVLILIFGCIFMSHAAYPDPAPDSFTWAHFRWFFPHFLSQVSWCLSVILGIWLFAVPSLIGHGWETVSKPIPKEATRKPSIPEPDYQPRRKSLMAVPSESFMREEDEKVRKSTAQVVEASGVSSGITSPTKRISRQSTSNELGFAFSEDDSTSKIMWERRTLSRQASRQKSAGSAGGGGGSKGSGIMLPSERGTQVKPSSIASSVGQGSSGEFAPAPSEGSGHYAGDL